MDREARTECVPTSSLVKPRMSMPIRSTEHLMSIRISEDNLGEVFALVEGEDFPFI